MTSSTTSSNTSKDPHVVLDIPTGSLKICSQYGEGRSNRCTDLSCPHLHICRSWLGGHCRFSSKCAFSHSLLLSAHNRRVIQRAGIRFLECEENMRREVMRSFSRVCLHYNFQYCKHGFECHKLHICSWFATYGHCKITNCRKEHRLHAQAIRILSEHGIQVPQNSRLMTADYVQIFSDVVTALSFDAYSNNVGIPKCKCYDMLKRNTTSPTNTVSSDGSHGTTESPGVLADSSYVPPHLRGRGLPSRARRVGGGERFEAEGEQLNGASQDQNISLDRMNLPTRFTRPALLRQESFLEEVVAFLADSRSTQKTQEEAGGFCDWDEFCAHFKIPASSDPDEWLKQQIATDPKRFLALDANVYFIKFVRYSDLMMEQDDKPDYSSPPDEINAFRLFRLCTDYNAPRGCNSSKPNHHCNFLHLCKAFIEGSCPNERVCKLNHRLTARVFDSVAAFQTWDDQRLIRFLRQCHPQVCEDYNTMLCTEANCTKLHICNDYLLGRCSPQNYECLRSHNLRDTHNVRVFFRYGVRDMLFNKRLEHMIHSLIMRYVEPPSSSLAAAPVEVPPNRQVAKVQPNNFAGGYRNRASPLTLSQSQQQQKPSSANVIRISNSRANIASPPPETAQSQSTSRMAVSEYAPVSGPAAVQKQQQQQQQYLTFKEQLAQQNEQRLAALPLINTKQNVHPNKSSPLLEVTVPNAPERAQPPPASRPVPSVEAAERALAHLTVTIPGSPREGQPAAVVQPASQRVEPTARTAPPQPSDAYMTEPSKPASQPVAPESTRNLTSATEAAFAKGQQPLTTEASAPGTSSTNGIVKKLFLCERHMREVCEHEASPGDCEYLHVDSSEFAGDSGEVDEGEDRVMPLNYIWQYCVPPEYSQGEQFEHVAHLQKQSATGDGWIAFEWDDNEAIERAYSDPSQRTWTKNFDVKAGYAFGGRSELQFDQVQELEVRDEMGSTRHKLKTRMKRLQVNAASNSYTFEIAKPVLLDVRCVRAPSRGILPAYCSRAAHWLWYHQLADDDSWANCEYLGAAQIGEVESRYLAKASTFRMKSARRLRQSQSQAADADEKKPAGGGSKFTYVFNLEALLLECVETGESCELVRRPAFLPLFTRDADS